MDKKFLVDIMNCYKDMRIELKMQIRDIENIMQVLPLFSKRLISTSKKYHRQYNEYGDCIDAIMNIIDYLQQKKLDNKHLKQINDVVYTFYLPPDIIEVINLINKEYNVEDSYDELDYAITYYGLLKQEMLDAKASQSEIDRLDLFQQEEVKTLKMKKNKK